MAGNDDVGGGAKMAKLRMDGQSIIEYVIILSIVAVASLAFVAKFLASENNNLLFSGYVANATGSMH